MSGETRRSRALEQLRRVPVEVYLLVPAVIAGVNAVILLAKLRGFISVLYLSSDTASAPIIASLSRAAPAASVVTLGNYPWYEAFWFMRATLAVPGHEEIWEITPIVCTAVSFAILLRVTWTLFGRWAALMTTAVLLCISPFLQTVFFTLDTHGPLLLHACALVGALVWLNVRHRSPTWVTLVLVGLPLAAFTAAGVASDPLAFVGYVIPFLVAAGVGVWRIGGGLQQRIAGFALGTTLLAVGGGELAAAIMRGDHISGTPLRLDFVAPGSFFPNLDIFANAFTNFGGGDFFGDRIGLATFATFAAGCLTLLALALVARWLWRLVPLVRTRTPSASGQEAGRVVYVAFWATVLVAVCVVFILSSAPQDSHSARYLANAYVAVTALLPLLAFRSGVVPRALLAAAIGVFAATSIYGTLQAPATPSTALLSVGPPVAGQIERFVLAHGAKIGYAGYWDAEALSWESQLRIQVYPAENCTQPRPTICPFPLNDISSWYAPRSGTASFLIVDPTQPDPLSADPAAGHPKASATFGDVTVYVYDYDIAATMGRG